MQRILFRLMVVNALLFSLPAKANKDIYLSLLQYTDSVISNNHCEIEAKPFTVAVFLSHYFEYVNAEPERLSLHFECLDNEGINCSLSFGQKANFLGHEGWNRILRFKYDNKQKSIDENTFICIDVP